MTTELPATGAASGIAFVGLAFAIGGFAALALARLRRPTRVASSETMDA